MKVNILEGLELDDDEGKEGDDSGWGILFPAKSSRDIDNSGAGEALGESDLVNKERISGAACKLELLREPH